MSQAERAPLVLIVGLQKSGTSLLLRLLTSTRQFRNPVRFEGKKLWGDNPPFSPTAFPAGSLYQRSGGERGHELGADDATPDVVEHLRDSLAEAAGEPDGGGLVLKNPYNTVRVPWLRVAFQDAFIAAVVRRPLPNVFSLLKKHAEGTHARRGPEEGWWGVKPAGWRELLDADRTLQTARQWERVNGKLEEDRELVDLLVPYQDLCADPRAWVDRIAKATLGEPVATEFPALEALDDEYVRGGRLESANKVYKRTGSLDLAGAERAEERLGPLTVDQQATILEVCGTVAEQLGVAEQLVP